MALKAQINVNNTSRTSASSDDASCVVGYKYPIIRAAFIQISFAGRNKNAGAIRDLFGIHGYSIRFVTHVGPVGGQTHRSVAAAITTWAISRNDCFDRHPIFSSEDGAQDQREKGGHEAFT